MTETSEYKNNSETSEHKEAAYNRIGRRLRKRRESKGMSIADASRHLHLAGMLVEDLEEGRVDRLAGLYRRGYIRNYARLLGLDADLLLAELEPDQPPELREVLPASRRGFRLDRFLKVATYVVVTIAIVPPLVIFYVQSGSRIAEREVSEQHAEQPAASSEERVARRISRALALDEPAGELHGPQPGHVSASTLPLGVVRPMRDIQPEPLLAPATEDLDENLEPVADPDLELTIRVHDDSWVEISAANGERLEYDLLRAGQNRSYRGQPPFRILLGRASSVELLVNGQTVEYAGHDRGDVVQLKLLAGGEILR